jgi:hypothetical protein
MGEAPQEPEHFNELLQATGLWRASSINPDVSDDTHSSGFALLDQELPGAGWPADGVTEFLHDHYGIGEFRLLAPALAHISQTQSRWILIVSPPYIPYPPALSQVGVDLTRVIVSQPKNPKDYLWVLEKSLASQSCSAVIAWPGKIQEKQIRRLQLASKEGQCWGALFRPEKAAVNASPAELRIRIRPSAHHADYSAVSVKILKRRGRWESEELYIKFDDQLQRPMPDFSEMIVTQQPVATLDSDTFVEPVTTNNSTLHEYQ